ncbi:MAG: tRNA(Met) cytidine acetyltransferase TmcA [Neptuniibacter sp.]
MQDLQALFLRLEKEAVTQQHRRILVVSGDREWCHNQVAFLAQFENLRWIGSTSPARVKSLPGNHSHKLLGQTIGHLVYDAWDGMNPNSFGQVSGCLSGGSILVLLCPDLDAWAAYDDPEHHQLVAHPYQSSDAGRRFISRFCHILEDDSYAVIVRQLAPFSGIEKELPESAPSFQEESTPVLPSKTLDQQYAVELILSQFRRGRRPVVITADRGRGKSVALGIAAAQLSGLDYEDILITAPEFSAAEAAFEMAHQLLPDYDYVKGHLRNQNHSIRFVEPETALSESGEGQVLLVDEAAAIPVPTLSSLLKRFPRIAFSSTIHGYEGTGQGFSVRFKSILDQEAPNWKDIHLKQPIRWSADDPLETLVFSLLMLNAEAADRETLLSSYKDEKVEIHKLDRDSLIENYAELEQLFGLLVLAHYRTTPGDLRILLDSPNLHIWLMKCADQVAGVVMVAEEGPLQEELIEDIWAGIRRPKGHLLPQTLVNQEGYKEAAQQKYGRIMRIAVHPALQRQQLGSRLLKALQVQAKNESWDCLGSSFSATSDLLCFWQKNGFNTIRMGSSRDSVSGSHAALVLSDISDKGSEIAEHLRSRFLEQLNYRLSDDLIDLEPDLVCLLLQHAGHLPELSAHDWSDLQAFAQHNRSYESCAYALHKFIFYFLDWVGSEQLLMYLDNPDFGLLIQRNLQQKSWAALEQNGQGRKQMMTQMRQVVALMLDASARA